ncbi:hypothetical protein NY78_1469 [Desulfovibrio sp. TomC]|nr:hypothetical protein NY78_1469 [Desulfovibrio sp. TomC]
MPWSLFRNHRTLPLPRSRQPLFLFRGSGGDDPPRRGLGQRPVSLAAF